MARVSLWLRVFWGYAGSAGCAAWPGRAAKKKTGSAGGNAA